MTSSIQIPREIIDYITDNEVEVEARFGTFTDEGRFNPSLTPSVFYSVLEKLNKRMNPIISTTVVESSDNIRKITDVESKIETWMEKTLIKNYDYYDYSYRISFQSEKIIEPLIDFNPKNMRIRRRYSFVINNSGFSIDMTQVELRSGTFQYIIEVELLDKQRYEDFSVELHDVLLLIQNSLLIWTTNERNLVSSYYHRLLNSQTGENHTLNTRCLSKVRNLKHDDILLGGIIGNNITNYCVMFKADGERKILMILPNGVWLVSPPNSFTLLTRDAPESLYGTILDGELIPKSSRRKGSPDTLYWFHVFDCLTFENDDSISKKPYNNRMETALRVSDLCNSSANSTLHVSVAMYKVLRVAQTAYGEPNIFRVFEDMLLLLPHLAFDQDGLIIYPITVPYLNTSGNQQVHLRKLNFSPDICKWKPRDRQTIDFEISKENTLLVRNGNTKIRFEGTKDFPYDGTYDNNGMVLLPGNIVEFYWTGAEFRALRIRHDKTEPNSAYVSLDVWDDATNGITDDDLKGNTYIWFDKHKERIVFNAIKSIELSNNPTLVCFGTPSLRIRKKFRNVYLINGIKHLHSDRIIKSIEEAPREVDVFLFLEKEGENALNQNMDHLRESMEQKLNDYGAIIFFVLDRWATEKMFSIPKIYPNKEAQIKGELETWKFGERTIEWLGDSVTINGDTRYPVNMFELIKYSNIPEAFVGNPDVEHCMTVHERLYARLHTFGILSKKSRMTKMSGFKNSMFRATNEKDSIRQVLPTTSGFENHLSVNDDCYQILSSTWTQGNIVRLGTIQHFGSSFYHALLKAISFDYQIMESEAERQNLVNYFVEDLRKSLRAIKSGKTLYSQFRNGRFEQLQNIVSRGCYDESGELSKYTLECVENLFVEQLAPPIEIIKYVSDIFNIDIFLFRPGKQDLYLIESTVENEEEFGRTSVCMTRIGNSFETIGRLVTDEDENQTYVQTLFKSTDHLMTDIKKSIMVPTNIE